jgi:tetratricopeptide (TPR) repeat protein
MALSANKLLLKAKAHERKGDVYAAEQLYTSVLQKFPKNKRAFDALKALKKVQSGSHQSINSAQKHIDILIALLQQGQLDRVVQLASPLAQQYPDTVAFLDFLGIAYMGLKKYDQCIASYQKALQIKPDFAEAHNNIGAALRAKGQLNDAISCFRQALKFKPSYAEALNNLGIAQQQNRALDGAIESFEAVLRIAPNSAEIYFNLGSAQKEKGKLVQAIKSFENGLLLNPNHAEALNHLGNIQQTLGQLENAFANYKKAILLKPDLAEAYLSLGSVYVAQGNMDDAVINYSTALKLKPNDAQAYRIYTSAVKIDEENEHTVRLSQLLEAESIPQNDQMHLNFAQCKVKFDLGQDSEAIEYLKMGNTLRKKELNYDISLDELLFDDIKRVLTNNTSLGIEKAFESPPVNIPIFILGMPRSGTTLVERIMSSHSDVYGAGELTFMDEIMNDIDWRHETLHPSVIDKVRFEYFNKITSLNVKQRFVTDKMPANFRWIGVIAQAFPDAKIIHIDRSPAAVCWSNYKRYFPANGMRYCFDMEDIAKYYCLYQNLMKFWQDQFPNRIYDINYEQLTENQFEETEKLLAYVGLDWQDIVIDFHKNTSSVNTASSQQVRTKMYQGSSQEWERYKEHLGPMLNILSALPS